MDATATTVVESLRPATVPVGLVALGTVDKIADFYIRLQIPGGIYCTVPIANISERYTENLESFAIKSNQKQAPAKPQSLFKIGQQYVCKILEARPKDFPLNSVDLIATLDPGHINEDVTANNLLSIPFAPIQCAVRSFEDHGYQVDIGFGSIFGFLSFEDAKSFVKKYNDNKQLAIGQIVKCCIKSTAMEAAAELSRVVHLTTKSKFMTKSEFDLDKATNHLIPARCIMPGSLTFGTIMKVLENGLIINLMNEYGAFATRYHLRSVWHTPKDNYNIADSVQCTVLFYHPITKTFAVTLREPSEVSSTIAQLTSYHIGHFFEKAKVKYLESTKSVVFKVDHRFKAIARGGDTMSETITGCDDDDQSLAIESVFAKGSKHRCRIKAINLADLLIHVSLKKEYLGCAQVSIDELTAGDFVKATIKKFISRGVLVKFGLNFTGQIPDDHLTDTVAICKASKLYAVGQEIKCRVLKVDHGKQPPKVYLTHKPKLMKKDLNIIDSYNCKPGTETHAVIIKIRDDGLIVELFNNVKGHIPLFYLSRMKIDNVQDVFEVGQSLKCYVVKSKEESRSLQLSAIEWEQVKKLQARRKSAKLARSKLRKLQRVVKNAEILSFSKARFNPVLKSLTNGEISKPIELHPDTTASKRKLKNTDFEFGTKLELSDNSDFSEEDGFIRVGPKKVDDPQPKKKKIKFLEIENGINWNANYRDLTDLDSKPAQNESERGNEDSKNSEITTKPKSRRQRTEESRMREEKLRKLENDLLDPNRQPQSVNDFERLVFQSPDSADVWIKYVKFYLDNVETDKARSLCRRALKTIKFRLEKEKLKIWFQMIKIEAKFGGREKLKAVIDEALETNDRLKIYQGTAKILVNNNDIDGADEIYHILMKNYNKDVNIWCEYLSFVMEHRKDQELARSLTEKASKNLLKSDLVILKSKFAQLEFRLGVVERGKTLFENLLSDNPKRADLWRVYGDMVRKYGTREDDSMEVRQLNADTLARIKDSIELVSRKGKTNRPL